jgi:putative peptide zinc metalloprotease protein
MAAIATAKILHELAHALVCKHFGGECHEMGMLLLVFTPCLYCDVSDIWMLPGKWQHIAVSAAGVVVECALAAACFLLWWFSEPGLFNSICFNMIVVCSVGTVVFNANPLLRFDGYYILADLVEVPNLRQQSTALVRRALLRWFFDFDPEIDRALPEQHRRWLAAYAIASFAYQVFVIAAILWFCRQVLKPHGLDVLAAVVTALVIGGFLIVPVLRLAVFLRNPTWSRNMNWRRFTIRGGVVALLAAVVLWVPLPYAIVAPVALTPADARRVYVSVPGTLRDAVAVGTPVALGTTLAQLENPTVQLDVVRLQADRDRQRLRVAQLERQALDRSAEALIPAAQDALADLEERLRQRRLDQQRLSLVAPAAGTVLPPPSKAESTADDQLPSWSGSPLDEDNRGGYLETGTWLCRIGDPRRHEALLVIDQTDLEFVRRGQTVDLWLDQYPGRRLRGEIYEIAQWDLDIVPRRLVVAGDLPVETRPDGAQQPWSTSYLARVRLDESAAIELIDATGRAKVRVAWQPLARRLIRWLSRTFRLE